MKSLLAITMLIGASSFTTAYAEWEILDAGTAVSPEAAASASATAIATESALKYVPVPM